MVRSFRVNWEQHEVILRSIDELDRLLDQLEQEHQADNALLVTVELSDTHESMAIGVGRDVSVLNYVSGSKDPPYFTSVYDAHHGDDLVTFRFMGEVSEFHARNTIPSDAARVAMRTFCRTGNLADNIGWEED